MWCILVNNTSLLVFLNTFSPLSLSMSCNTFHHLALKQFFFFFTLVILADCQMNWSQCCLCDCILVRNSAVHFLFPIVLLLIFCFAEKFAISFCICISVNKQAVCCSATSLVLYMNCMHIVKHCGIICSLYIAFMSECF